MGLETGLFKQIVSAFHPEEVFSLCGGGGSK